MKWLLVLMVSVMILAFSACGATATPEQELMERAESYYSEINRQNWSDARKHLAPSIQKVCPSEDFTVAWIFAASLIKGFADISANEPITYKVKNVSVNGSQGTVYGSVWAKGKELFEEEDSATGAEDNNSEPEPDPQMGFDFGDEFKLTKH